MNKGERSITIDEVPLDWCFQPGVKLDFRHLPDGHVVGADEVEAEPKRIGHELKALDIVVVNTRAGSRYGQGDFVNAGCGMGYEATMYLLERGVRLTGTDAWSWDAPFSSTAKKFAQTGDKSLLWEGHKAGGPAPSPYSTRRCRRPDDTDIVVLEKSILGMGSGYHVLGHDQEIHLRAVEILDRCGNIIAQ